jgi:hypothetical protein
VRRRQAGTAGTDPQKRQPATTVHADQTPKAAIARVHRHLPAEEAAARLQKRFQIINLWRPIAVDAFDTPLAMCDYRSVDYEQDLVPTDLIYTDREPGETFHVRASPNHQWKYIPGLRPSEYVLLKW